MVRQLLFPFYTILFNGCALDVFSLSSVDQSGFERSYENKRFVEHNYNGSSFFVTENRNSEIQEVSAKLL